MRGGLERWKRGIESQGVRQAMAYAFRGTCDSHLRLVAGVEALVAYGSGASPTVTRFVVEDGAVTVDELDGTQLRRWVDGRDPAIGEMRGRVLLSPDADLILDGTINAPKSFSVAAVLDPELAAEFEELQDRLRTRIIQTWQRELNARRGSGGRIRESLCRVEVVELRHRRSRALDPHIHRHLWLNVKVQGRDGKWSNVDSRVAMKLHTLINAEGDLAARTDPVWVAALARHGYTRNADGEIAELVAAVKPLSRRSNQIEANRVRLLHQWRDSHPGQEPDHAVLQQVDRWAWASGRPGKPEDLDETEWEQVVRGDGADSLSNTTRFENVEDARLRGVEVSVRYDQSRFYLGLNGSLLRGDDEGADEPLEGMPADFVRLYGAWKWPSQALEAGMRLDLVARQDRLPPTTDPDAPGPAPGYAETDLFLSAALHPALQLELAMDNVFDRRFRQATNLINNPGRNLRVQLAYRF